MSLKYGVLNFLVFSVALLFTLKNYDVWTKPIKWVPEKVVAKEVRNKPEAPPILEKEDTPASLNSFTPIAERNIFSPERKDFPITTAMRETGKPTGRPPIILYGVVITLDYQSASVLNPGRPLYKGERETKTIKVGDRMGGYKLAKILPDRITMETQGDSFDVLLYDPKVPKKKPEIRTAEVKTVQPSPVTTATEGQKPVSQAAVMITKEPIPEQLTPSPPIRFRETNFPNRSLARQSRAALISRPGASQK
jgi:hypothetical protein